MKTPRKQYLIVAVGLLLTGGLVLAGLWLKPRLTVGRIRTAGITSYYVCSGTEAGQEGKLPTIIFIGHLHDSPFRDLSIFKNWFDEPVLLIWSGLMSDLRGDSPVDNEANWAKKRQQFLTLLDDYKRKLRLDEDRIYLTGFSSAGVYAWMLAYDHPELYAAVVPMSATSYPRQIQEHLEAARTLVTVVVRGEKDERMQRDLAGETRTGRIIESSNSGSRFVLKPGEGHHGVGKYWRENLQYVLQFRRNDTKDRSEPGAT
jgi:predicted esterase